MFLAWAKIHLRLLSFGRGKASTSWIFFVNLIAYTILLYIGISLLGDRRETSGFLNYLDWYLLIAWSFLFAGSYANFVQLLFPAPESLFLHTSPISRWRLYFTRLVYIASCNLFFFFIISFPLLVMLGLWGGQGWIYFALVLLAAVVIPLIAALAGAIVALPIGFLLILLAPVIGRVLPRIWRDLLLPSEVHPMRMPMMYLVATALLPLLPPISLSRWSLTQPLTVGSVPFTHLAFMGGSVLILSGVFLWIYTQFSTAVPFPSVSLTPSKRGAPAPVRFYRLPPLLRRELANTWKRNVLAIIGTGAWAGGTFAFMYWRIPAIPCWLIVFNLVFFLGFALWSASASIDVGILTSTEQSGFFLMRLSPSSFFCFIVRRFLIPFSVGLLGSYAVLIAFAITGWYAGHSWAEASVLLLIIPPALIFPVVAILTVIAYLTLDPSYRGGVSKVWAELATSGMVIACGLAAFFILLYPLLDQLLLLAAMATAIFVICLIATYLLLRLAARRLARIEWL